MKKMEELKKNPEARSVVLGNGISIKGTIVSEEDLFFEGEVEGSIEALRSTVTVGLSARLEGSVRARRVIVAGSVHGPVAALESIELRGTSKLIGDVVTSRIVIEDGAYFKGSIAISPREPSAGESRAATAG